MLSTAYSYSYLAQKQPTHCFNLHLFEACSINILYILDTEFQHEDDGGNTFMFTQFVYSFPRL